MSTAKELQDTWFYIPAHMQKRQINHLLENCKQYIVHEINKLIIFKWSDHCQVINTESLILKYFDTEQEAMDFCLDVYKDSGISDQLNLFEKL